MNVLWAALIVVAVTAIAVVAMSAWGGSSRFPWGIEGTVAAILLFHSSAGFFLGAVAFHVRARVLHNIAYPLAYLAHAAGALGFFATRVG